jgi:TP901 family phage tail tape measure protein
MADVNANIGVHIDTSAALAELKNLQRQLATFHSSVAKNSAASAAAQKNLQTNLLNSINATGKFSAQMGLVRTSTESFTHALEKNKLSMREYFRYAGGSTKSFGKLFRQEFDTIGKVAEERVKKMQTQYIKMGRDASGAMKAMAITPRTLDMNDYATKTALAAQKQALFNQLVKQGSTNLLNFGKNTQWAGRQLMVGFTVPLAYFGTAAAKTFMDLEAQAVKFKRVYGDMFTTTDETTKALADIEALAKEFTKYGVSAVKTMELASQAAAMGKQGADLTAQVAEANRLAVLGGVEQTQALETTISITNAFGIAAEDLASKINFLNAVENQTVVSIEDLTIAIPKAGPVVQQLGGDVEDLAFFLTAMKEGGINASEGANALKSGLASLINPTKKASEMLAGYGINIKAIVEGNQGNVRQTVIDFARALDTLDPLNRARAIEQLFGKFQFSRLSTLFQNVTKDGTQASKVLQLAGASVEQLAILSERELKTVEDAVGTQFKSAVEELKLAIAPIGKTFLEAVTPIVKTIGNLLDKFNNLGDGTKKFIVIASTLVGIIGPTLLMTFGLLANGVANIIKLFLALRGGFLKLGGNTKILAEQTNYMNAEQMEAATVAASLNQAHTRLTQSFTAETSAVRLLRQAYIDATVAAANFARANPGMMMPGKGGAPKKFARGTTSVPGRGNKDNVPAVLMPGEAVIPTDIAQDPQYQPIIEAMMNGTLQAFGTGTGDAQPFANSPQFQPKMDLSGPSAQVLSSNPSQVNRMVAGLPGFTEGNEAFAARSAALLAKMNARKNKAEVTTDGKVLFGGKEYSTTSQKVALGLKNKIDQLAANGYTPEKIISALDRNVERGRPMTASQLERRLSIGRGASTGTSAPSGIRNLAKQSQSGFMNETRAIKEVLKRQGIVLTPAQEKNLFNVQASHIQEVRNAGVKEWKANNLVADLGYVNNYLNTVKGKLGQTLLGMSDEQLKSMGIDRNELKKLQSGTHPTNARAAETLRAVARYDASINPNSYQAKAVLAGLEYRSKSNFYSQPMKTLADIAPTKKSRTKTGVVDGQTGRAKPASVGVVGGGVSDRRQVAVGKGETILNKKTTSAIRSGKPAFIPGLGKIRIAGAEQGVPTGQKTGSTTVGAVSQSAQLSRAQLIAATEKISLKEAKRRIAAEGRLANAMDDSTKAQMTTREKLTQFSSKAGVGIGAMSGLTIAASFAGGQVGEMAQKIMPFVFGLQGITMLLPMLANPWVAAIAAIAVVGGVFIKMAKDVENARKAGVDLAKSMNMTSEKLQGLAEITGTVSATEEADRKRQNTLTGEDAVQRKFGQNILGSDFGKGLMADIEKQAKSGQGIQQIGMNISNSLAYAIVQGVITTDQARSIASALGEELKSYEIPAIISGRLTTLLGPNGENLATDPLKITLAIQEDSMQRQADFFKTALEGSMSTVTFTNVGQVIGGGITAAVGGLMAAAGVPALAAGGVPGAGLLAGGTALTAAGAANVKAGLSDQNQRREVNANLGAAALQLGLEQVAMNNGLVDSLNKQYDIKVKMAKTDAEIKTIEEERKAALDTLNAKNAEALNLLIAQKDAFGPEIFTKGINAAIDTLYKDGPMKVFADEAKKALDGIGNADFKAMLQVQFASGALDPVTIMKLANNENLESKFTILVEEQGSENANLIMQLLMKAGVSDTNLPIFMDILNKDPDNFNKNMNAIAILGNMQQKYGITIDVNDDGANQLKEVAAITEKLAGITGEELTKQAFLDLGVTGDMTAEDLDKLWTTLVGTSKTINKSVIVDFVAAGDVNVVNEYMSRKGITAPKGRLGATLRKGLKPIAAADLVGRQGKVDPKAVPGGTGGDGGGTGSRDTTLDDILNRLKMVRKASINATGGIGELLKVTKGKGLTQFSGVMQTLMLQKPGAMNREFLDFITQMDDKTRKTYMTIKNGQAVLTEQGKALKEAFDEAVIGEYRLTQSQTVDSTKAQWSAFMKLKAAGVDAAQAIEMVADAELAVAINGKDITSEELALMAFDAKAASEALKDLQQDLNMQTREGQFAIFKESFGEAMDYFDAQEALVEQERKAAPAYQALNKEIDAQTAAIDAAEKVISDYQNKIGDLQFDLENNTIYGSKVIDNLNSQVDALNRSAEINFDRPLANLNDESSILSNTLGLIDRAAESINEKYDAQEQALSKISQLNSEIASQEKQRLTLADALSQGDISAAAAAAQEMRATAAEAASRRSSGTLAAAREAEIGAVSVSGMTRVQIEERQFQIGQQTFALEQQRQVVEAQILAIQDQIYAKELLREPINKKIRDYQFDIDKAQRNLLVPAQQALDKATLAREQYEKQTEALIKSISYQGQTKDQWVIINTELTAVESKIKAVENETSKSAKNTAAILASWQALKSKTITLTENVNRIITTTNIVNTSYTSSGKPPAGKMYGGKILPMNYGGMVPSYFAAGGRVGSDSVPAMLTPGEFVMNKAATKRFGPMLNQMNNSKFPSMIEDMTPAVYSSNNSSIVSPTITSVATTVSDNSSTMYNYNIGISVPQSNASSNDIARAVIGQIKYIDSQRIRGQK